MDNAYFLFSAMAEFRKRQITNRETYLQKKKNLERYRGSVGFEDDLQKIRDERKKANASARAECSAKIEPIFNAMYEANAKRGITAPSEEAIRILTAVSMMKKPSKEYLQYVARSLDGNALALEALHDIAVAAYADELTPEKRFVPNYSDMAANELSGPAAAEEIRNLQNRCTEILNGSGASRVRSMTAELSKIRYGGQYDPDDLPQEEEYKDERDFYQREGIPNYELFASVVNA